MLRRIALGPVVSGLLLGHCNRNGGGGLTPIYPVLIGVEIRAYLCATIWIVS